MAKERTPLVAGQAVMVWSGPGVFKRAVVQWREDDKYRVKLDSGVELVRDRFKILDSKEYSSKYWAKGEI